MRAHRNVAGNADPLVIRNSTITGNGTGLCSDYVQFTLSNSIVVGNAMDMDVGLSVSFDASHNVIGIPVFDNGIQNGVDGNLTGTQVEDVILPLAKMGDRRPRVA